MSSKISQFIDYPIAPYVVSGLCVIGAIILIYFSLQLNLQSLKIGGPVIGGIVGLVGLMTFITKIIVEFKKDNGYLEKNQFISAFCSLEELGIDRNMTIEKAQEKLKGQNIKLVIFRNDPLTFDRRKKAYLKGNNVIHLDDEIMKNKPLNHYCNDDYVIVGVCYGMNYIPN